MEKSKFWADLKISTKLTYFYWLKKMKNLENGPFHRACKSR